MHPSHAARVRSANAAPPRPDGDYVLYWMVAARRTRWNFALDRASAWARELGKPLLVYEPLRTDYPWASDRLHRFLLDGMRDQAEALAAAGVTYWPYVEPAVGAGQGLLEALAARACVVVTDDFPVFFLPLMVEAVAQRLDVKLETIDGNGLYPMRLAPQAFPTAFAFRRHLQKCLHEHLPIRPSEDPLARLAGMPRAVVPEVVAQRWPAASASMLAGEAAELAALPIDHGVGVATLLPGGARAAEQVLERFIAQRLVRYATERNEVAAEVASGLSPYLHFGHIGVHHIFDRLARHEGWSPERLTPRSSGSREGYWGMSVAAESFLDELVTWREVGFNMAALRPHDYDRYESLPGWAQQTLAEHAHDPRPHLYDLAALEAAETHDPLWNAAQRQLLREGRMHNYLRMLWGKKVLEWSESPQAALAALIELNNKYAVDGRDPNSYSGIFWCLGRYDRAWGPERPIFGKIRYMSSDNTARKLDVKGYLARYRP